MTNEDDCTCADCKIEKLEARLASAEDRLGHVYPRKGWGTLQDDVSLLNYMRDHTFVLMEVSPFDHEGEYILWNYAHTTENDHKDMTRVFWTDTSTSPWTLLWFNGTEYVNVNTIAGDEG